MPRERRKWTEGEDTILRDAVLKGGEGACDWHLIASCIPGRTNKDCRKRWHYKVAATVNKGPWEVTEDEKLWAAVQEHGSRWALVAQVVKTRNGDQCSKRWYDALDPSIDHSPWTPDEDSRLLEAIDKHGRNWKAIVKAYFPRRTSLSAKNRYSLLVRKMEPKSKHSQSNAAKKEGTKSSPQQPLPVSKIQLGSVETEEDQQSSLHFPPTDSASGTFSLIFGPGCQYNVADPSDHGPHTFKRQLTGQSTTSDETSYTPESSECPSLSPTDWSSSLSANAANSEASLPGNTPPGLVSNEDMSLFFNDLQLNSCLNQGNLISFANEKQGDQTIPRSFSMGQRNNSSTEDMDYQIDGVTSQSVGMDLDMMGDSGNMNSRIVTVLINSEIPETVNSIVNQIGREAGVSIAIHLE